MSALTNALNLFKADFEVDAIPVVQGAIALYKANPTAVGKAAAIASLIGNAPVALLTAESQIVQQGFTLISNLLAGADASALSAQAAALAALSPASTTSAVSTAKAI